MIERPAWRNDPLWHTHGRRKVGSKQQRMMLRAVFCVLLLSGGARAETAVAGAAHGWNSALSTGCNKAFVPGRAGGFTEKSSPMACCVLDQALEMAWVLQSLLYCDDVQPGKFGARCNSEQAHFVKLRLEECCTLFRPFYDPCHKHTQDALDQIERLAKGMGRCAASHGHGGASCVGCASSVRPLLPGILASSTSAPVRFPQTEACAQAAELAVRAFQLLRKAAATIYLFELNADRTRYAKALMSVCSSASSSADALRCAGEIVNFFRTKMKSKMWPVGISSRAAYVHPGQQ